MPGVGSGRLRSCSRMLKVLFKVAQQGTCNLVILSLRIPESGSVHCWMRSHTASCRYLLYFWTMADCILHERLSSLSFRLSKSPDTDTFGATACEVSPAPYGTVTGHVFNVALKGCWHGAYMPVYCTCRRTRAVVSKPCLHICQAGHCLNLETYITYLMPASTPY